MGPHQSHTPQRGRRSKSRLRSAPELDKATQLFAMRWHRLDAHLLLSSLLRTAANDPNRFQRLTNFPQGEQHPKAPHFRFLCWVMLFRTLDLSIDKRERLTCPLSSCNESFGDQQYLELVNHVSTCSHLERGLYDCPYCRKEESFCWELPYAVDDSGEENSSTPGSLSNLSPTQTATPVQPHAPLNMNVNHSSAEAEQNHLFSHTFAEFDRATFPEVFVSSEGGRGQSSTPAMVAENHKRRYSEFEDGPVEASFAEFSNDNLPETTGGYSPYHSQYSMPAMTFELPSTNAHLSPRASPGVVPGNSPQLMQRALEMNLDPFQMGDGVSPGFNAHHLGQPTHPAMTGQMQQQGPSRERRAMSNASTVIPSQHSPSQLSPSHNEMGGYPRSRRTSRTSNASAGVGSSGSASLPEEAERSSLQCKECGKVFTGKAAWLPSNLQRHNRETHLNVAKVQCRICGKDFNRGHNLRHHMKAVHGEQP